MNFHKPIVAVALAFMSIAASAKATDNVTPAPTPIENTLSRLIVSNPDSALHILDSSGENALSPQYLSDLFRAQAYHEKRMFNLSERYAIRALSSPEINDNPKRKLQAMTILLSAYVYYSDYKKSIDIADKAIRLARETGNQPEELNVLLTMAKTSFSIGNRTAGYEYLDHITGKYADSDNVRILANVSAALGMKIVELYTDDKYPEALSESQRRLNIIDRIDRLGGAPKGFTDQQRAYTYARMAATAQLNGNPGQAAGAYEKFMSTDYGNSMWGRVYVTDYLLESKRYEKVLEYTQPLFEVLQQADTINVDYESLLTANAKAYRGLGDTDKAYTFMERTMAIQDSLSARERESRAQELAIAFDLNEKELALVKSKADIERRNTLLIAALGIAAVTLIILIVLYVQYNNTRRRNKIAAAQIDALIAQRNQLTKLSDKTDGPDRNDASAVENDNFLKFESKILAEKLFLLPNINRDLLAQRTGLSRAEVIRLIQEKAKCTPSEYINRLKVEYSVTLIKEHPEWTIEAIAEAAGYTNRGTYYQQFNRLFGLTPAQYRKEALNL